MATKFLKIDENNLDKLYNNMLKEHSLCTNIIAGENFTENVITDRRKVYNDIEKYQEKEIIKDIKLHIDTLEEPKEDFYNYVNARWLKKQQEIVDKSNLPFIKVDSFRVKQQEVYSDIILSLDNYLKVNSETEYVKNVKRFCYSCMNVKEFSPEPNIMYCINLIDKFIQNNDLYGLLASMNSCDLINNRCPIYSFLMPEETNSQKYNMYITLPNCSLPVYSFYFQYPDDTKKIKELKAGIMVKYKKYIDDVFTIAFGSSHGYNPQDVIDVETEIINTYFMKLPDKSNTTQLLSGNVSQVKYNFNYTEFCKKLYYKDKSIPRNFRAYNKYYIKNIMTILNNEWTTKKWITFWYYVHFNSVIQLSKYRDVWFQFNQYELRNITEKHGMEYYICGLSFAYNNLITQLMNVLHPRTEEIDYVKNLFKDIRYIFKDIIKNNTWMSRCAKKEALRKLKNINLIIGSPPLIVKDPDVTYTETNFWRNIIDASIYRAKMFAFLNGKGIAYIPTIDWDIYALTGQQSYIVNAFYTANQNSIFIPHAILSKPFVDLTNRGIEYNLAYIGFTLSHEISHSLDSIGSQYDHKGNLKNWWSPRDKRIFDDKVNGIIQQYKQSAKDDGLDIDPTNSVGEDLADINGFRLIEQYLVNYQLKNRDTSFIKLLSFKALYIYYAIQSRQAILSKAIYLNSLTNPHPLEKYRVNCVLSRSPFFKHIYEIKKGDKMYSNYKRFW
jgi:putative endopeptidase